MAVSKRAGWGTRPTSATNPPSCRPGDSPGGSVWCNNENCGIRTSLACRAPRQRVFFRHVSNRENEPWQVQHRLAVGNMAEEYSLPGRPVGCVVQPLVSLGAVDG